MNKKVFSAALALVLIFLAAQYILKIFFPNEFVLYVSFENVIKLGEFIDNTPILFFSINLMIGIISDYLYFGAVLRKIKLPIKILIIMLLYNSALAAIYAFVPNEIFVEYSEVIIVLSTCYLFIVPIFFTKELLPLSITYCCTYVSQLFVLNIRNLSVLLTSFNTITLFLVSLESYLWTGLCFVIFNYKKEVNKNGNG